MKDCNQQIYLLFKGEERPFMEEEAKSNNLGVVYWMRECLVGSAGEQTSEQMTTYLGIPQTAAKSSNLGVVYWKRECLVGPAGEQTSEQMITYLGRQPPD